MRPLSPTVDAAAYSSTNELAREVFDSAETPAGGRKRKAQQQPVSAVLAAMETALAGWTAGPEWTKSPAGRGVDRLAASVATGPANATRWLVAQTGPFCAYCDTPGRSGLLAEPVLPLDRFPLAAFAEDHLVLACAACRAAKGRRPDRDAGASDALLAPAAYAWPQRFWKDLADGALLPFRHDLVRLIGGQPTALTPAEIEVLLERYRAGDVAADTEGPRASGALRVDGDGGSATVASWISATSTGRPVEAGTAALIDLLSLNAPTAASDRRLELRTAAHLRALDLRDRLQPVLGDGLGPLYASLTALLTPIVRGTGSWGVWRSVFRDVPAIAHDVIDAALPGTAPRAWTV